MCIEKELRDSTRNVYKDNFSGAGMCPDPKKRKAKGPHASFALFARRRAFGHIIAVRHHNLSQVSIPIDHIDSHITLRHGDAEAAVLAPPFFNDVATMFSTHLNQALCFPRAPLDLQLEKLESRRQNEGTTINGLC